SFPLHTLGSQKRNPIWRICCRPVTVDTRRRNKPALRRTKARDSRQALDLEVSHKERKEHKMGQAHSWMRLE
ncbi:MAG TPA: hypothetical protein VIY86_08350, partial [Pirellulaceae bacterium]